VNNNSRGLIQVLYRNLHVGTEEKRYTSVRISGVPADIRTNNTSLERYRYTNLLGHPFHPFILSFFRFVSSISFRCLPRSAYFISYSFCIVPLFIPQSVVFISLYFMHTNITQRHICNPLFPSSLSDTIHNHTHSLQTQRHFQMGKTNTDIKNKQKSFRDTQMFTYKSTKRRLPFTATLPTNETKFPLCGEFLLYPQPIVFSF
jgi:hypothetical protein